MSASDANDEDTQHLIASFVTSERAGTPLTDAQQDAAANARYKLIYFDARGVVETVRVMFYLKRVPYIDFRFPVCCQTFARPEYDKVAEDGVMLKCNMNRVPVLQVLGQERTCVGQSKAIERFVAGQHGFMGSTPLEAAQIDMICEHVRDIKQKYCDAKAGLKGDKLVVAKQLFMQKCLPCWMKKLEASLPAAQPGLSVGSKISLADVVINHNIREYFDDKVAARNSIAECPKLQRIHDNVEQAAAGWYQSRPETKF